MADLIGADPESQQTVAGIPYEYRTKDGTLLGYGRTSTEGLTGRVFAHDPKDVYLYVGDAAHTLTMDIEHKAPKLDAARGEEA